MLLLFFIRRFQPKTTHRRALNYIGDIDIEVSTEVNLQMTVLNGAGDNLIPPVRFGQP